MSDGTVELMIPNVEIKNFETTVIRWFDDSAKKQNRQALLDAVWSGNSEDRTREMNVLLRQTISYHEYSVDSNKEHGEGRSDVVYDSVNGRVAVFEAK